MIKKNIKMIILVFILSIIYFLFSFFMFILAIIVIDENEYTNSYMKYLEELLEYEDESIPSLEDNFYLEERHIKDVMLTDNLSLHGLKSGYDKNKEQYYIYVEIENVSDKTIDSYLEISLMNEFKATFEVKDGYIENIPPKEKKHAVIYVDATQYDYYTVSDIEEK